MAKTNPNYTPKVVTEFEEAAIRFGGGYASLGEIAEKRDALLKYISSRNKKIKAMASKVSWRKVRSNE